MWGSPVCVGAAWVVYMFLRDRKQDEWVGRAMVMIDISTQDELEVT